jgi:phage-related protein
MLVALVAGGMYIVSRLPTPANIGGGIASIGQGTGGAIGTVGQGVGGALSATGQGVGGAVGSFGQGITGAIGGFFNALGTGVGSALNPSGTMVRQVYQFHDDGLCWFDQQFADGHWTSQGPLDRKSCGG